MFRCFIEVTVTSRYQLLLTGKPEMKFKEIKIPSHHHFPTLEQFKQWLLQLRSAALDVLNNQPLFMACFWTTWKNASLPATALVGLIMEILHRRLPSFQGSELDQLLQGRGLREPQNRKTTSTVPD